MTSVTDQPSNERMPEGLAPGNVRRRAAVVLAALAASPAASAELTAG